MLARILELDNLDAEWRLNEELWKERNDVKIQFDHAVFKEEVMWRQKVKIQWAKEWDTNSNQIKGRMGWSLGNKLKINGGCFIEDENGIEKEILEFFNNLDSKDEVNRPGFKG